MANLYELTADYLRLQRLLEDGAETPEEEQAISACIEQLAADINVKADGYARVVRNMTAEAEALRAEEKRLAARRRTLENGIDRLKTSMMTAMQLTGEKKVKTSIGSWSIQKNPQSVAIVDEKAIPAEYWKQPEPELNRTLILSDLKAGCIVDGCELQQTEGLRFR